MKKLKLKLEGMKEMLTKEQMKKISGGYNSIWPVCYYNYNPSLSGCDGHPSTPVSVLCYDLLANCVESANTSCSNDSCCTSANCGCSGGGENCYG